MLKMKYLLIAFTFCLFSCKGTKDAGSTSNLTAETSTTASTKKQVTSYKELAAEKLGKKVQYDMNKSQSMVLCKKVTIAKNIPMGANNGEIGNSKSVGSSNGGNTVHLIVVNVDQNDIVFEKNIAYGSAEWATDTQLKITEIMGANMPNNPSTYLYDVISKKKTAVDGNMNDKTIEKH